MRRHAYWVGLLVLAATPTGAMGVGHAGNVKDDSIAALPAYARVEVPFGYHTDEWAIVTWYRSPGWVLEYRPTFNLLDLFDIPYAFTAPLMCEGTLKWEPGTPVPLRMEVRELPGMPAWIVSWPELQTAMGDGEVTIVELLSLSTLRMGEALYYHEVLHPIGTGRPVKHNIQATGILEDGSTFKYHYAHGQLHDGMGNATVKIDIAQP